MAIVFFDFDSTVCTKETLDEVLARALSAHPRGPELTQEVERITALGMEGVMSFRESLEKRLSIIPISRQLVEEVGRDMVHHLTPGMPEVFAQLRESGHGVVIVSGGFFDCIYPSGLRLGLTENEVRTNNFIYNDDIARVDIDRSPMVTIGKSAVLNEFRASFPGQTFVIVGDGMNDYRARAAGAADLFIGFGGNVLREPVKAVADHFAFSSIDIPDIITQYVV